MKITNKVRIFDGWHCEITQSSNSELRILRCGVPIHAIAAMIIYNMPKHNWHVSNDDPVIMVDDTVSFRHDGCHLGFRSTMRLPICPLIKVEWVETIKNLIIKKKINIEVELR